MAGGNLDYIIDPGLAGLSGDMILSAFADLAGEGIRQSFNQFVRTLLDEFGLQGSEFTVSKKVVNGMAGCQVKQNLEKDLEKRDFQSIRGYFQRVYDMGTLSNTAVDFCQRVLAIIINAEASVHGKDVNDNSGHFHELGSIDTVIDICGISYLFDRLEGWDAEVVVLPINTGSGKIKIAHGVVDIPAPAVAEILCREKMPFFSDGTKAELVTPTGAAILAGLKTRMTDITPLFKPVNQGRGHGSRKTSRMNYLRVMAGNLREQKGVYSSQQDEVVVLETNVDDLSGEILGSVFDRFLEAGALDVAVFPFTAKKNRPASCLRLIVGKNNVDTVVNIMFKHLRTLGIRMQLTKRFVLPRKIVEKKIIIRNKEYVIRVKIAGKEQDPIFKKIEFDDLESIACDTGLSIQEVRELIDKQLHGGDN